MGTGVGVLHADVDRGVDDAVAEKVEAAVDRHPALEHVTRIGWVAKGVVYTLMGLLAMSIARSGRSADEDASPEGALSVVMARPAGRVLLAILAVGLVLYSLWRALSVTLIRGTGLRDWLDRIGYTFSAAFYAVLATVALRAVFAGEDPERSTTVERLSHHLLGNGLGRVVAIGGGFVIMGVGVYFAQNGFRSEFLDELDLSTAGTGERRLLTLLGTVGLLGRAVVTFLVGLFVTVAAVQADPSEARGFDRSLRHVATSDWGAAAVLAAAVGLVVYGLFCLVSLPRRHLA